RPPHTILQSPPHQRWRFFSGSARRTEWHAQPNVLLRGRDVFLILLARIFVLAVPMNITTRALIRIGKSALMLIGACAAVGVSFLVPDWSKANEPPYKLAAVERGPIISTVAAAGTINPITTIIVGSQLSGQIVEILADYNDNVRSGQILARLNSDQIRFKRDAALADLAQARATKEMQEAKVVEVELAFERQAKLKPSGVVSEATYDTARTARDAAKAQLQVAIAKIEQTTAVLHQIEV